MLPVYKRKLLLYRRMQIKNTDEMKELETIILQLLIKLWFRQELSITTKGIKLDFFRKPNNTLQITLF